MPRSRCRWFLLPMLGLWSLAALSLGDENRLLELGLSAERELAAGETHIYRIAASPGRLLKIAVRPRGIDVDIAMVDHQGREQTVVASPGGRYGAESLLVPLTAEATVEIRSRPHRSPGSYRIALEELPESADPRRIAGEQAMTRAGEIYSRNAGQRRQRAVPAYLEALELWRRLGDRPQEARTLFNLGALHNELGKAAEARGFLEQALGIWPPAKRPNQAAALNQIGYSYAQEGDSERAVEIYRQALALRRHLGDLYGEALTLSNLAKAFNNLGAPRTALEHFERALDLARQAEDDLLVARILNNLGGGYLYLGEVHSAARYFRQALDQQRTIADRQLEATALLNLGATHRSLGEYHQALEHYQEALGILRALGNRRREATTLNNIGFAYLQIGEPRRARAYFERALPVRREVRDRRGEASTLHNLGWTFHRLGRPGQASDLLSQALGLRREMDDRPGEAETLIRLAAIEAELGDLTGALEYLGRALMLSRQVGNRRQEARILRRIGEAHSDLGQPSQALGNLRPALALHRAVKDTLGEATTLAAIGRAEQMAGDLDSARQHLEAALDLIEEQRARIATPDLRASFLAEQRIAYQTTIELLMTMHRRDPAAGHDIEALLINERARARGLLDLLNEAGTETAQATDPELAARRRQLLQLLNLKAERRSRLLSDPTPEEKSEVEQELGAVLTELDVVEGQIRQQNPGYDALTRPRIVTASQIRQLLDDDTLLLEYALGERRSFLWAITADRVTSFELPAREKIETTARDLYEAWSLLDLREGPAQARKAAELSALILGPVAPQLTAQRLVVVADGVLHYIPFAALPTPAGQHQPLLLHHEVVQLSSASVLAAQRRILADRPPAPGAVAVLADPVFDVRDPRVNAESADGRGDDEPLAPTPSRDPILRGGEGEGWAPPSFARLPMTRREAQAITALSVPDEVLLELDFKASRELATSGILRRFRIVHLATHGVLDSRHPEFSGLVLSQVDASGTKVHGFLDLHDVYNLQLAAELVILSGCQTALGKEIRGEGLVGLTRGFMYAGATRVLASLWRIQDRATSELMAAFYRALLVDELPVAAALRTAQLRIRAEPRWQDPYYWAPFIVQGDWR